MNFNNFQFKAFATTVETGSFSAAARRLGKAQSAVSTAIMNLEIDLGVPLFDRGGRYPRLTAQGKSLLRDVHQIISAVEDLQAKADTFSQQEESLLTLAMDEAVPWRLLTDFLTRFSEIFPNIDIKIIDTSFEDCQAMVNSGMADIGCYIASAPVLKPNMRVASFTTPLVMVSPTHPLAQYKMVTNRDLARHRQLIYVGRNGTCDTSEPAISSQVWWVQSSSITREIIRAGLAWGYLPEHMARKDIATGQLKELPLSTNESVIPLPFVLTWRTDPTLGPGGQYFVDHFGKTPPA